MSSASASPRVTLGIATYNRDTYLAEAIASCLTQDYDDFEVLVVVDGSTNPAIDELIASVAHPRLRVVRHERNLGIAAAYNTFVREGRGELIAMLGDDDVCLPDRLSRQVAIFDRFPDTGVVHGDATVIDARGAVTGPWSSQDFTPAALMQSFLRDHNHLVDPTRMVHRRVYDAVGGYGDAYPLANDFDFWLRAAPRFRFRHCAGGPLVKVRRHESNTSDETARAREIDDVTRALAAAIERHSLRELVPDLDWAVLEEAEGERQALLRLAERFEARQLPLPELARRMRERARAYPAPAARRPGSRGKRLVMTSFGWNDSGGGTTVPRLAAKELARRGWDVTVFHAAVARTSSGRPYELREWEEDGVALVGVHNRPSALFDAGAPERELDDPAISTAFGALLDRAAPDVVHFHNLHNLGASLFDHAAARGLPAYFSTHNYWLVCPRVYLLDGHGRICAGPGDRGGDCAACVGGHDTDAYRRRLAEIRARATRSLTAVLAVSDAMRHTLTAEGYPPELIDVVRQAMPMEQEIWNKVGRDRSPGRVGEELTVGFLGSAYPHKGPQLLVQAAQRTDARVRVLIHGEVPPPFAEQLEGLDRRGVVELCGAFAPSEIAGLLRGVDVAALPSMWWDCAPLAAAECRAARVPLVVPRLGGLPEAVQDGVDGLTFDGLDVDDLARQLDRLADEPGLLERLQDGIAPPRSFTHYIDELEAYYAGGRPCRAGKDDPRPPAVRWVGEHGQAVSLSIINGEVGSRLPGPVQYVERDGAPVPGSPPLPHVADVEVRHQWPPDLSPASGGRLAVIQPWEFGAIPTDWVAPLRENVDELWVPSEFVRRMYLGAGLDERQVVTIPNGVDLERFSPEGARSELDGATGLRFLFVGGLIWRKGHDVLLAAWRRAFAGRDDVTLVVKDVGVGGVYRNGDRDDMRAYAAAGELPRVQLIEDELSGEELAALYRACDLLVHPYRGEGFAMPVLEAMACGLPVVVTDGGPTDEFCPPQAGWRIRASRAPFPSDHVDALATLGRPWVLEPDADHLAECLLAAAADPQERARRGLAAREAAAALSWDAVAARYAARVQALAAQTPLVAGPASPEPLPLSGEYALRVLATPAWRGADRLGELLAQWTAHTTREDRACLYLLADPLVDGDPAALEARVLAAAGAGGADIDAGADIDVLMEPMRAERDARLHASVDAYVPLHGACAGHQRLAAAAGNEPLSLDDGSVARAVERLGRVVRVA